MVDWVRVYQNEDQIEYSAKHVKNVKSEWSKEEEERQEKKNRVWPKGEIKNK